MDLLRCEMCNSTITNFVNHRCLYHEYSYQGTGFKNPDCIFGKNPREIPATISHSAEGADFNTSQFMDQTSTFQSSTFPQSTDQERHWDVNSTAATDVWYALSNAVQNKNFDYFKSSRGSLIPAAQHFENSACTSGVENLPMPFFNAAYTSELNPVEVPWTNSSALMQPYPNLSFHNQLPSNSPGPSNDLTKHDLTIENFNIWRSMESAKIGTQYFKISRFPEKENNAVAIARNSNRTEKNTISASDSYGTSLDMQYHGNPRTGKSTHTAALQLESTNTNTVQREKFHNKFLNIPNFSYPNFENKVLYSNPDFGQGFLDSQPGMNDIPHYSNKSQTQFNDKIRFQNIFQCQFCGKSFSYQRNLNGEKLSLNSGNVPIKCNECNEMLKSKEKIQTYPKIAEYWENSSVLKVPKKRNPLDKRFPYASTTNILIKLLVSKTPTTISETTLKKSPQQFRIQQKELTLILRHLRILPPLCNLPIFIDQERHWDVNSTAGTYVRYASSNAVQNENFDYFNSSQGILFPATQHFENSDCPSGVENPAMAFFTEVDTNALNPVEQLSTNNSAWLQHDPDLSFYNQLPPNSRPRRSIQLSNYV
ncbi:hypothetical protein CEXT_143661 [Caerostris extrusa]|uniref:C2H2-type domain-containing protein n=1 Tax=Caerostris extrusa TaxID=172846 RepID=A0AAV4NYG8_CAEEX|nr:hypothetical protein CEXT_143661 [Caerostris extrusa]